jgi:hypothetical protein
MPVILGGSLKGFERHQLSGGELSRRLQVDPAKELMTEEARRRLVELGPNELTERSARNPWTILWDQLSATSGGGALGRRGDLLPTLSWPRQIPIGGEPADVVEVINRYGRWLAQSQIPKLYIHAEPGEVDIGRRRTFVRQWPNQKRSK